MKNVAVLLLFVASVVGLLASLETRASQIPQIQPSVSASDPSEPYAHSKKKRDAGSTDDEEELSSQEGLTALQRLDRGALDRVLRLNQAVTAAGLHAGSKAVVSSRPAR